MEVLPPITAHDVRVRLAVGSNVDSVTRVPDGTAIDFESNDGWISFTMPPVRIGEMVVVKTADVEKT
jgi:hypothetical protein